MITAFGGIVGSILGYIIIKIRLSLQVEFGRNSNGNIIQIMTHFLYIL